MGFQYRSDYATAEDWCVIKSGREDNRLPSTLRNRNKVNDWGLFLRSDYRSLAKGHIAFKFFGTGGTKVLDIIVQLDPRSDTRPRFGL